ncbi:MAG: serine hydrolase domain-containing protein, partial [Longimicrobiales bacterium]
MGTIALRGLLVAGVFAAATAMLPAAASAQWTAPSVDTIARVLEQRIERGGAVGVIVGFHDEDGAQLVAAGERSGPGSAAPDGETVFEIGSVAKVFTTTLLAHMVASGEVALDDPIAKYLPATVRAPSRNGIDITLLDLATATSGLPRMPGNLAPADANDPYADYDADDLYAFLSSYELPRDPGAIYEYSNLGMGLLGHLLALRAGVAYEDLVIQRILEPLGMNDTRITPTPSMRARTATGHSAELEPTPGWTFGVLAGAGGWRSTANDMLRFLHAVRTPPAGVLGEAMRMAIVPQRPVSERMKIGLGWH